MTTYDDYGMPAGSSNFWSEEQSLTKQALRLAHAFLVYRGIPWLSTRSQLRKNGQWNIRGFITLVKVLVVLWFLILYWGERSVFRNSVNSCKWDNWEEWPRDASPHRLVFVADPQLVDPHTYPGRPWPLSTLTVKHTDLYLRRTFSRIQTALYPDSVVFLGDLFDGGREWSTYSTTSPDAQWRKYGQNFWLKEYDRFGGIFFEHWGDAGMNPRVGQPGRKIISSLPGNHDLGFGQGIQSSVRKRFSAYFGEGNRIDILGNHTLVSLDTVSLSALGQHNPQALKDIWKPTMDFLDNAQAHKKRLVSRELRAQQGLPPNPQFSQAILEENDLKAELPHHNDTITEFPTILLSHVPLYRAEGTPCGPLREHWPPTAPPKGQSEPLEKDERNAIAVRGGYQYQNVLAREITQAIAEKVGNIQYAFSGDDHDYCEVVHRAYPSAGGGIREITVKSTSWAMGVRKPGVVMLSLWNPVDEAGNRLSKTGDADASTLQSHLCLLPDQLHIFIRYATLFIFTILALMIRAALVSSGLLKIQPTDTTDSRKSLLPISEKASSAEAEKAKALIRHPGSDDEASSKSSASDDRGHLQIRSANARTRSVSPAGGYGLPSSQSKFTYPLIQHAGYYSPKEESQEFKVTTRPKPKRPKGFRLFIKELRQSVLQVASVAFIWYFWLIWKG